MTTKNELSLLSLLNIVIFLIGITLNLTGFIGDDFWLPAEKANLLKSILISVGCSLIATSIVAYITSRYQLKRQKVKELIDVWGVENIYETRSLMNVEADKKQLKAKKCLDAIGFGFSSWRQNKDSEVRAMLERGVKIRILTPDINNEAILNQQDKDEEDAPGHTKNSILKLKDWVSDLKGIGDIELRMYDALPLDFYFRIDETLFIGPYLYKNQSQQTVSYEYSSGGKMFASYTEYFETVWNSATEISQSDYD